MNAPSFAVNTKERDKKQKKENGICARCTRKAAVNKTLCAYHNKQKNRSQRKHSREKNK